MDLPENETNAADASAEPAAPLPTSPAAARAAVMVSGENDDDGVNAHQDGGDVPSSSPTASDALFAKPPPTFSTSAPANEKPGVAHVSNSSQCNDRIRRKEARDSAHSTASSVGAVSVTTGSSARTDDSLHRKIAQGSRHQDSLAASRAVAARRRIAAAASRTGAARLASSSSQQPSTTSVATTERTTAPVMHASLLGGSDDDDDDDDDDDGAPHGNIIEQQQGQQPQRTSTIASWRAARRARAEHEQSSEEEVFDDASSSSSSDESVRISERLRQRLAAARNSVDVDGPCAPSEADDAASSSSSSDDSATMNRRLRQRIAAARAARTSVPSPADADADAAPTIVRADNEQNEGTFAVDGSAPPVVVDAAAAMDDTTAVEMPAPSSSSPKSVEDGGARPIRPVQRNDAVSFVRHGGSELELYPRAERDEPLDVDILPPVLDATVEPIGSAPPTDGDDDSERQKKGWLGGSNKTKRLYVGIAVAMIVVVAAVVPAVVLSGGSDDDDSEDTDGANMVSSAPTFEPSEAPSSSPTRIVSANDPVYQALLDVSRAEDLSNRTSPQYKALEWIVSEDALHLNETSSNLVQRYALMVSYYATDGINWDITDAGQYGDKFVHECEWTLVNCSSFSELSNNGAGGGVMRARALTSSNDDEVVTKLELQDLGLKGRLPPEFRELQHLEDLNVSGAKNSLSGSFPPELYNLTKLRSLDLSYNNFDSSIDEKIGNLRNLQKLNLRYNGFTGELPITFRNLTDMSKRLIRRRTTAETTREALINPIASCVSII